MPDAFGSSAARHWEDAKRLFDANRFDNAAYLAGYAVECSLKVLIQAGGPTPKRLKHELPAIAGDALYIAHLMAPFLHRYPLHRTGEFEQVAQNWSPELRYAPTGHISRDTAITWIHAAEGTYRAIVIEAALDGWTEMP